MDRRSFLLSLGIATLGQGLMGCRRNVPASLQVNLVAHSLPSQLVGKFKSQIEAEADLKVALLSNASELFTSLQKAAVLSDPKSLRGQFDLFQPLLNLIFGSPPTQVYRVSSLGDYWLQTAIAQNLIRPWPTDQLKGWNTLPPQWQRLVKRDRQGQLVDSGADTGQVWGAPYRWGATVIVYRKDKFRDLGWTPTDWADLWRSELKDKLSMLDQPREVIGLTLKKLGHSYNSPNLEAIPTLQTELKALDQQVKVYSSTDYLQPLLTGDIWAAVGWSSDILPLLEEGGNIAAIAPKSGTALWSDLWVLPQNGPEASKVSRQWMEFWWKPDIAKALAEFTNAVSPILGASSPNHPTSKLLQSNQDWLTKSEFLEPLSADTLKQFQTMWKQI